MFSQSHQGREAEIAEFFEAVFAASEGPDEGAVIKALVERILSDTSPDDLLVTLAEAEDGLAGAVLYTPLWYDEDERRVMMMAPVAVRTGLQKQGWGQALIRHGLELLASRGVDIVVTYGDPAYYAKTGFRPISEEEAAAPKPLSIPQGWQAQGLSESFREPLKGGSRCVAAFDDPGLW